MSGAPAGCAAKRRRSVLMASNCDAQSPSRSPSLSTPIARVTVGSTAPGGGKEARSSVLSSMMAPVTLLDSVEPQPPRFDPWTPRAFPSSSAAVARLAGSQGPSALWPAAAPRPTTSSASPLSPRRTVPPRRPTGGRSLPSRPPCEPTMPRELPAIVASPQASLEPRRGRMPTSRLELPRSPAVYTSGRDWICELDCTARRPSTTRSCPTAPASLSSIESDASGFDTAIVRFWGADCERCLSSKG
eukprot:scaffold66049_cov28-Tisochrysis_lutea.AAC.7